uniref:Uncharacterized protein n=1 Tax=Podoviridae sp. ctW0z17 TaxID=2825254 RepID=A0A8S5UXQ0_9CAUD|nr:MAG TPA: hypothetical protein [Podoviridae sp. ctW0z17]DAP60221.1 MAG TPA: hypothetical protein [Caudoviricetes sp.]DAU76662.1 MAG TPA: hypothetical protein [Caudoviricetes sp.]
MRCFISKTLGNISRSIENGAQVDYIENRTILMIMK